jgi:hypothetical protein
MTSAALYRGGRFGPSVSDETVAMWAGTMQAFLLTGQLCWTQAEGVYVAHPGAEILALRAALDAALEDAPTAAELAALGAIRNAVAPLRASEATA